MEPQVLETESMSEEVNENRPKLYIYPDIRGIKVFDEDELNEESMLCLCTSEKCYVWRGEEVHAREEDEARYVKDVCKDYYGFAEVRVEKEVPGEESSEFFRYFSI